MTTDDARQFLGELISQLLHADMLITEQAERIDALENRSRPAANSARH
jgi:hypothetical protein